LDTDKNPFANETLMDDADIFSQLTFFNEQESDDLCKDMYGNHHVFRIKYVVDMIDGVAMCTLIAIMPDWASLDDYYIGFDSSTSQITEVKNNSFGIVSFSAS
jgi:hypothetical protein